MLALCLSTILAVFAYYRKSITLSGTILAWAFAVCIMFFGGIPAFLALASTLVFAWIAGKLYPSRRKTHEEIGLKHGSRDIVQIICNVAVGTLMLLLYGIFEKQLFLVCYGAAMAASLADSMASEIGVLSSRPAVDIRSGKRVPAGLSGGITPLGVAASAVGAIIIAVVFAPASKLGLRGLVVIALSGLLAALLDSLLGSVFQVKYRCRKCGSITEKPVHCGMQGEISCGVSFITNDTVNLLNNIFAAVVAAVLILIVG